MKLQTLKDYEDDVNIFEIYLLENYPEFPSKLSKIFLAKFLKTCNRDFVKASELLKLNLEFRFKNKDLFLNRNFHDEKSIKTRNAVFFTRFPKMTKDGGMLSAHKLCDFDPKNFDYYQNVKTDLMNIDICCGALDEDGIPEYEIGIVDGEGVSFTHLFKVMKSLLTTKTFLDFLQTAVPFHLTDIHVVNVSPVVKSIYSIIKRFLNEKTAIHFHSTLEEFTNIFDKDILPSEYGGEAGSYQEISEKFHEKLSENSNSLEQFEIQN